MDKDQIFDFFKKESFISRYQVILINEGQFFEDLYKFTDYLVNNHNKKVYVCGLDGDFQRKKFGWNGARECVMKSFNFC